MNMPGEKKYGAMVAQKIRHKIVWVYDLRKLPGLYAAAGFIGKDCAEANEAFAQCKKANADPSSCISNGSVVVACASRT